MPPVAVYPKRPRRDEEPASNQAVSAVTPPAANSTAPQTIFKNPENQPAAVAQPAHMAVNLGHATLATPLQDQADSLTAQPHHAHLSASSTIQLHSLERYLPGQQVAPLSAPPPPAPPPTSSRLTTPRQALTYHQLKYNQAGSTRWTRKSLTTTDWTSTPRGWWKMKWPKNG